MFLYESTIPPRAKEITGLVWVVYYFSGLLKVNEAVEELDGEDFYD
jgi:hypothetical protein